MLTFYNFFFPERRNITYSCTDIDIPASASFHRARTIPARQNLLRLFHKKEPAFLKIWPAKKT